VFVTLYKNLPLTAPESEINSARELTGFSTNDNAFGQHTTGFPAPPMESFMSPPQRIEPNFGTIDLNELSASLGLPSARKEPKVDESPARSQKSHTSQGAPNELLGKLIDRALNKPLTADSLAHYMKSQSESSDETIKAYQTAHNPANTTGDPNEEQGQALKVVPPPPGFGNQMPRMVTIDDQHAPNDQTAMPQNVAHPLSYAYYQQYPNTLQSTIPLQQQQQQHTPAILTDTTQNVVLPYQYDYHQYIPNMAQSAIPPQHQHQPPARPNPRKRERRPTRTKRTDQGPEPSAADIYPDDAHWTPPKQSQQSYFAPRPYVPVQPQPVVQPSDATSWPTPAEVYKPATTVPVPAHVPQEFNVFAAHTSPTHEDLIASDGEVLSLLGELPDPTIQTLINFGAFDLLPQDRPLSPYQLSGKRYGLNYLGVGLGDDWKPPVAKESDPFRVRPRDHDGWGGWEWAIKKGWGDA
jgi:hypothetical protein